ncbi:MAG: hypothetical protein OEU76_01075 [Cyclobacteriaceae bacterium]|nr:hypothetical protein [Cyclobacteriaceae bacterium]
MIRIAYFVFCLLVSVGVVAQSSTDNNPTPPPARPSSVEPYYPKEERQPKKIKPLRKASYSAVDNFYERKKRVAKANRKAEKELLKPQYSDPSYFGHKKPPKRNPPGKTKYCKECGLRH